MYCKVYCGTLMGILGTIIEVEVDIAEGFPKLDIVGMPSNTIQEAKERVRTGIKNSGYKFPYKRITINLAPAHIRKEGVGFDLAIAVGVLCCEHIIHEKAIEGTLILGEIALNGDIRPIKGILALVDEALRRGLKRCIIPHDNLAEATLVEGIDIIGVKSIIEVVTIFGSIQKGIYEKPLYIKETSKVSEMIPIQDDIDFNQVIGQKHAKRGLEIAVSGMHHVMLIGPPGIGKTMLAKRIKTILPPLNQEEILELTKIYSAAEKLLSENAIISERPFRDPHHSITRASFIGGSSTGKPGEISLSHKGVLMLDEFPEFKREVIESLREPLEQGNILLSRNHNVFSFPARFMLVAAMNPCPCGHYPNVERCTCIPSDIDRYQGKISGPILDRIDLHVEMNPTPFDQLVGNEMSEGSITIRQRVNHAHSIQKERYIKLGIRYNSQLGVQYIKDYCSINKAGEELLNQAYHQLKMSSRSYHRLLKVARTLADMDGSELIEERHIGESILFRSMT